MKLIRGLYNIQTEHTQAIVTIGNFDGVHLGHKAILNQVIALAKAKGAPSMLITFEPQPSEFFSGQDAPPRLTNFREKFCAVRELNIDYLLCLPFNKSLAQINAQDFVEKILVNTLQIQALVTGEDFQFGYQRQGNIALLQYYAKTLSFDVNTLPAINKHADRVSSTKIRACIKSGQFNLVYELLGRPYTMEGRVIQGDQRGRSIGFPTANIQLHRQVVPFSGVYTVTMEGVLARPLAGVANIGVRPTVCGKKASLEVHLLNYQGDFYGRHVKVTFLKKIRDEKKFNSLDELKQQIAQDVLSAVCFI